MVHAIQKNTEHFHTLTLMALETHSGRIITYLNEWISYEFQCLLAHQISAGVHGISRASSVRRPRTEHHSTERQLKTLLE